MIADGTRKRWRLFCEECAKLAATWLLSAVCLMAFRVFFIAWFSSQMRPDTSTGEIGTALVAGFGFDSAMAGVFLLPAFVVLVVLLPLGWGRVIMIVRCVLSVSFFIINLLACVITITYFQEYNDQFNHFVFLGLYDDQIAVLKTVVDQYHPFISISVYVGWLAVMLYGLLRVHRGATAPEWLKRVGHPILQGALMFLALLLVVVAARGSFGRRPAMRVWAEVTTDPLLNKTIITPVRSFVYALRDFRKLQAQDGSNPYMEEGGLAGIPELQHGVRQGATRWTDVLGKTTRGPLIERPRHIFVVVMESYDAWPLQDAYAPLGLTEQVGFLGEEGLHFKNFLPASASTMDSLATIISGVPYAGVNISRRGAIGGPSITSAFEAMEELGYQTNFYYGGLLSWQNLGNFVRNQGAEGVYSAVHAGGKGSSGVWGVDDDQLFQLVLDTVGDAPSTFNVIMTTTYHGPFLLDVCAMGYPYETEEDYPESIKALDDGSIEAYTLGHLWFSDRAVGDFVRQAEGIWPDALFALTGDHYGRRYFHSNPNLYEVSAVPLVLYGEGIVPGLIDPTIPGSHVDIVPTLIELFAPSGHVYNSYGEALQHRGSDSWGQAYGTLVLRNEVWRLKRGRSLQHWTPQLSERVEWGEVTQYPLLSSMLESYNRQMGLAWQHVMEW